MDRTWSPLTKTQVCASNTAHFSAQQIAAFCHECYSCSSKEIRCSDKLTPLLFTFIFRRENVKEESYFSFQNIGSSHSSLCNILQGFFLCCFVVLNMVKIWQLKGSLFLVNFTSWFYIDRYEAPWITQCECVDIRNVHKKVLTKKDVSVDGYCSEYANNLVSWGCPTKEVSSVNTCVFVIQICI